MTHAVRRPRAAVQTATLPQAWLAGSALLAGALLWATQAGAQDLIETHGYSYFGELKYPEGFAHLDYVNPDAPKGGEIAEWAPGTFDGFNPYFRGGNTAALSTAPFESIVTTTADDPTALYCYLCTTMEYPEDLSYVIFNLRDDVTYSDGSPMTAEDIKFS